MAVAVAIPKGAVNGVQVNPALLLRALVPA
jgi:hypothetical protein